jgi:hypothetical protein
MKLQPKQTVQSNDLAETLRGDQGSYLCEQGGQTFFVTAAEGHSIKSGPTPIGPRVLGVPVLAATPWNITKISNEVLEFEARRD